MLTKRLLKKNLTCRKLVHLHSLKGKLVNDLQNLWCLQEETLSLRETVLKDDASYHQVHTSISLIPKAFSKLFFQSSCPQVEFLFSHHSSTQQLPEEATCTGEISFLLVLVIRFIRTYLIFICSLFLVFFFCKNNNTVT